MLVVQAQQSCYQRVYMHVFKTRYLQVFFKRRSPGIKTGMHIRYGGVKPMLAVLPLSLLAYHLAKARGQVNFEFPSPEAAREHYETIHRATVSEPA